MQNLKRIASGAIGALMAGSTMLSPVLAAGLEDFSSFTTANSLIVVGADAATADVVGGINIGATVARHGATSTATTTGTRPATTGSSATVTTSGNTLEVEEAIGVVHPTVVGGEFDGLKSYTLTNTKGNTKVNQFLRLDNDTTTAGHGKVRFLENRDGQVTADYLYFTEGKVMFEYQLEFETGRKSDIDSDKNLKDYKSSTLTVLGKDYNVVTATTDVTTSAAKSATLTLIAGSVQGSLAGGEKGTYTYAGNTYEVSVVFISNPQSGTAKTILSINGASTKELASGETTVVGGVTLGISNLLVNNQGGIVTFFLGANKLVLKDTDITNDLYSDGSVEINNDNQPDVNFRMKGSVDSSAVMKLTEVRYQVKANAKTSSNIYVPAGGKLSAQLEKPAAMLHDGWDIQYNGLSKPGTTVLKFLPSGNNQYDLQFTTNENLEYKMRLVQSNTAGGYKIADGNDKVHWVEATAITSDWANTTSTGAIAQNEFFVLNNKKSGLEGGDETSFTHVLRYSSLSTSDSKISFTDLATGTREVTYKTTGLPTYTAPNGTLQLANASAWSDTLIVGGNTYRVFVDNQTGSPTSTSKIAVDLNGDNTFNSGSATVGNNISTGQRPAITLKGGGIMTLPLNDTSDTGTRAAGLLFNLTTLKKSYDTQPASDQNITVNITTPTTTTLGIAMPITQTGVYSNDALQSLRGSTEYSKGLTNYGVAVELYTPSSGSNAGTVTVEYPLSERTPTVVVVGAAPAATTVAGSGNVQFSDLSSSVTKLDTEVTTSDKTSKNLILVGGPAVNTLVADLGTAGKTPLLSEWRTDAYVGRAIVQYIADAWGKPAIIVAGYEADDTRKAALALATTALTGMGESWTGTTMSAYTYTAPAPAATTTTTTGAGTGNTTQ